MRQYLPLSRPQGIEVRSIIEPEPQVVHEDESEPPTPLNPATALKRPFVATKKKLR